MTALEQIRELYKQLPEIACKGLCANGCGGIDMSRAEHERIVELGVFIPRFTEELARRWQANEPLHCPALNRQTLRCDVYEDRPMICRLWGLAESMRCPNGCKPTRELTDAETYAFLLQTFKLGGGSASGQPTPGIDEFLEQLRDPELGPLLSKLMRGDRSVEPRITELINRRNRAG